MHTRYVPCAISSTKVASATDVRPGREIAELEVAAGRLTPMGHHCKSAADIRLLVARELDLGAVGNGCDGCGLRQAPRTADFIPPERGA